MKKRTGSKREMEEIDAILPFMSLLIIIIPLLLSNLAFYHFRVVETSRPGASDPNQAPAQVKPSKERKITAQLLIEPSKIKLEFLDEADGRTIKKVKAKTSVEGAKKLFTVLKTFKAKFPKLNTVMVTTHEKVIYQSMMEVLDIFKKELPYVGDEASEASEASEGDESVEISLDTSKIFKFNIVIMPAIAELSLDS